MFRPAIEASLSASLNASEETSAPPLSDYQLVHIREAPWPLVTGALPCGLSISDAVQDITEMALERGVERSILLHCGGQAKASIAAIEQLLPESRVAHMHIAGAAPTLENIHDLHDALTVGATLVATQTKALLPLLAPMIEQRVLAEAAVKQGKLCQWKTLNSPSVGASQLTQDQRRWLQQHADLLRAEVELRVSALTQTQPGAASVMPAPAQAVAEEPIYAVAIPKSKRTQTARPPDSPIAEDGAPGPRAPRRGHAGDPAIGVTTRSTQPPCLPPFSTGSVDTESSYASISEYAVPADAFQQAAVAAVSDRRFNFDSDAVLSISPGHRSRPLPAIPGASNAPLSPTRAPAEMKLHPEVASSLQAMIGSLAKTKRAGLGRLWKAPETFGSAFAVRELRTALNTHREDVIQKLEQMRASALDMSDDEFESALDNAVRSALKSGLFSPDDRKRLIKRITHRDFAEDLDNAITGPATIRLAMTEAGSGANDPQLFRDWLHAVYTNALVQGVIDEATTKT